MKKFLNELGNEIEIEVLIKDIDEVFGIEMSITGPTSKTQNHITRGEAEVLYEALSTALGKSGEIHTSSDSISE